MLRPDIRANDARANHCSVKNESGRVAPLPMVRGGESSRAGGNLHTKISTVQ